MKCFHRSCTMTFLPLMLNYKIVQDHGAEGRTTIEHLRIHQKAKFITANPVNKHSTDSWTNLSAVLPWPWQKAVSPISEASSLFLNCSLYKMCKLASSPKQTIIKFSLYSWGWYFIFLEPVQGVNIDTWMWFDLVFPWLQQRLSTMSNNYWSLGGIFI